EATSRHAAAILERPHQSGQRVAADGVDRRRPPRTQQRTVARIIDFFAGNHSARSQGLEPIGLLGLSADSNDRIAELPQNRDRHTAHAAAGPRDDYFTMFGLKAA